MQYLFVNVITVKVQIIREYLFREIRVCKINTNFNTRET